jgi:hypothetical protein
MRFVRRRSTMTTQVGTIRWRDSLDEALAESRETGRPVLLDFFNPS